MSAFISLEEAATMTRLYRSVNELMLSLPYQNQEILPLCETFDAEQVRSMLDNEGCVGLRVYYGVDADNKIHAVLVGVDLNDADILPGEEQPGNYIIERSERCPSTCPPPSVLNS
jgi:hypothetical protein